MFADVFNLVILVIAVGFSTFVLAMFAKSKKYNQLIEPLDDKEYQLKELYGLGFHVMERFKVSFKGKRAKRIRKECLVIYGEKYAEYYLRVDYARRLTFVLIVANIGLLFSCMCKIGDKPVILFATAAMCFIVDYYFSVFLTNTIEKRSKKYLNEFPEVASTIALLVNAGMILTEAWNTVAESGTGLLYDEMKLVKDNVSNGESLHSALNQFANRCSTPEIKKFISIIIQSIDKGNKELEDTLRRQSSELWMEKKQSVLVQGELAANKLLIPVGIMFIGILVMIMVPIMSNIL